MTAAADIAVPIDVAFFADEGALGTWKVQHEDGTVLFTATDEEAARARYESLRGLARVRISAGLEMTGKDMLTLFPPTAPASLLTALSAEELEREDVFDPESKTWAMRNVEIFRSGIALKRVKGEWKTLAFTADDVKDFVEAFAALGWTPPVKIGHGDDQAIVLASLPALARVTSVREAKVKGRDGSDQLGLFADLGKVPTALRDAIRDGRLFERSIEFWSDRIPKPAGGGTFRRVLKAVALLGSELPAVGGMKPLDIAPAQFAAGDSAETETVNLSMENQTVPDDPKKGANGVIELSATEYEKQRQDHETLKAESDRQKRELEELKKLTTRLSVERTVESATGTAARLRDAGKITPAQEPIVLELLKALDDENKDAVAVSLSATDGKTTTEKLSVRGALVKLIETFPKHTNAPGASATRGNRNAPAGAPTGFASLSAEEKDTAIAKLGEKYAADQKLAKSDLPGHLAAFNQARKDLEAGKADYTEVLS